MIRELQNKFEFMNVNLRVLTIRQILGMFFRKMVITYSSLYILAVGGGTAQIGIVNSLLPLAGFLLFPISGYLTDRTGRVKLIAITGYFTSMTMLLYVFAPSWEWIAIGALLQGFEVFQFPPSSAILADSMDPRARGKGIATMFTLANGFAMFSPYIAGIVLEIYGINFGMRILYTLLAISIFICSTIILKFLRETASFKKNEIRFNIFNIMRDVYTGIPELVGNMPRSVKAFGVFIGMSFIANAIAGPFWVVYVIEEVGLSKIDWGLILLFESIFNTTLTIPCGLIADRFSRTKSLFASVFFSLISMPLFIMAKNFLQVLLVRLFVGLAGALFIPSSTALMADYVPRELRGRVMSAIGRGSVMIGATGGGIGGPGMGYLFTIPVIVASITGGLLYSMNPVYTWICALGTTVIQLTSIILFIRDPEKAEE